MASENEEEWALASKQEKKVNCDMVTRALKVKKSRRVQA